MHSNTVYKATAGQGTSIVHKSCYKQAVDEQKAFLALAMYGAVTSLLQMIIAAQIQQQQQQQQIYGTYPELQLLCAAAAAAAVGLAGR
jgi:hypothetical protein